MTVTVDEISLVMARLTTEEGYKQFLYDDATDLPVKAPKGNATIGFGCNVQAGWTSKFAWSVMKLQVLEVQEQLLLLPWYLGLNAVRRSVILDIAFNDGYEGVLGFPRMIAAITAKNWQLAQTECHVKNAVLQKRYTLLSDLLLTGVIGP